MGLLGNGFRHNLTGRISVATTNLDGCNASSIPASYNLTAMRRNMLIGGISNAQASVPAGKRPPNVWLMAKEGGSISSFKRANYVIDGSAAAEMGFSREAPRCCSTAKPPLSPRSIQAAQPPSPSTRRPCSMLSPLSLAWAA
jgi:hypothetical protein